MAHNGVGLAVQVPDIGRLVEHFDGVVAEVNGVKNEMAKFNNNLAPLAQANAIMGQLRQMHQEQQDQRQQFQQQFQDVTGQLRQMREEQQDLRQQVQDQIAG